MLDTTQLNDYRQRILAGEDISVDEYTEIIRNYRATRGAAVTSAAPKTKARAASAEAATPRDLATMMAQLQARLPVAASTPIDGDSNA
jgi:hypothetical protein